MKSRAALLMGLVLAASMMSPAMAAGPTGHYQVPGAVPSVMPPAVNDGQVNSIVQVGSTVVIGGTFTSVTPRGGAATARSQVASFDASTGALRSFSPVLNGEVMKVLAGPTADTVYVAGRFSQVNGVAASRLALLNVNTGVRVPGFAGPSISAAVTSLTQAGGRLLIGGYFTTVGGQTHKGLAALNPTTGVVDHSFMGIDVTERHNTSSSGAQGAIGVKDMEATPDGAKTVVIGNFRKADGLDRDQVMVVNLSGATAVVDPTWRTRRFEPLCYAWAFDSYMRGVAVSPDGKFFVISTTGGGTRNTLCDTASRFEFSATGDSIQPTWINSSGGDTLWSAEVTEHAVYVGGHQRWQNNSDGQDYANQGAVPRPGLAALDVESGLPISWNPGRSPRGAAAFSIYASPTGLWVGSDTDYFGNWQYKRPKLGYFPLAEGAPLASRKVATLPGDLYLGGRTLSPAVANNLSSIAFGSTQTDPTPTGSITRIDSRGVAWDSVRGAFLQGDKLFYAKTDGYFYKRTFTRAETGAEIRIDPYNDPEWADVSDGVGGTLRGKVPTVYGQISSLTGVFYANNRMYYTRSGDSNLYWRWFNADSGIIGSYVNTANGGRSWSDTGGLFASGDRLWIVSKSTGRLHRMAFANGTPSGSVSLIDSSRDWRARVAFIGPAAPAPNQAPTAAFTTNCEERTCTVNGSASSDSDGSVSSYAWTFGDGGTATGVSPPAHTYGADGEYTITLTVTDNAGATASTTRTVDVAAPPPPDSNVSFVDQNMASTASATTNPQVGVPGSVQAGDQLVLVGSYSVGSVNAATPAGWTLVSSRAATGMESYVWTRRAQAGDAGDVVSTQLSTGAKSTLSLAAYRGVAADDSIAGIASSTDGSTTQHTSPTVTAPGGAWVLQVWTDKSSGTTTWTPPAGVTVRGTSYGGGTGRTSGLLVDSGGAVAAGSYGNRTAVTDFTSGRAIAWTIALRPAT